jgi:NAD(P)-dependent dehydrogenase (short-subunit alcohol dehydrogenase family)
LRLRWRRPGAKIVINDIGASLGGEGFSATPAEQTKGIIEQRGGQAVINTDSVSEWENAKRIVQSALDSFGRIDIVVNNAGILRDQIFHRMSPEEWLSVINVTSRLLLRQPGGGRAFPQAGKRRLRTHHQHLGADRQFRPGQLLGGQARHRGAVQVHALDMQRYNVRSNCLAPFAWSRMTSSIPPRRRSRRRASSG